ncbi:MAG: corrinoid protein [Acidobacteriota bacterium]|jgi:5-methyltetrahydrofolate--homocysteine methyltransferase|nr:corrinoid protein [Acidobacteriota bacterium]
MEILQQISESLQRGEHEQVAELTRQAIDAGLPAPQILNDGLMTGMDIVGQRFGAHEIFLPELLLAARAMNAGIDLLKPLFLGGEMPTQGKVVIGTVKGDLHDIGKNLVGIMLKGAGYEVIDVGCDVTAEVFVDAAEAEGASVVGLSALLTTTMTGMKEVVELVRTRGLQDKVKVIVGGAPLSKAFADEIGADAYGYDASNAVEVVKELVG